VHRLAAVTRGACHSAPVALLQVATRGCAGRPAHLAQVVARIDVRVALGATDLARVLRPSSAVTAAAAAHLMRRMVDGGLMAVEAPGGTKARSGVARQADRSRRPWRVALVLGSRVAIGAGAPRSVLGLVAVTGGAVLESRGGDRAVVEGRGVRVAIEAGHIAAAMLLLPRVAGGATSRADGSVGDGGVVDVVVDLAVERAAGVTGRAPAHAVESFGWMAGVAGRRHDGEARMGVGAVTGGTELAVMRLLALVLVAIGAGGRRLLIDVVVVGRGRGAVARGAGGTRSQMRSGSVAGGTVGVGGGGHLLTRRVARPAGGARSGLARMAVLTLLVRYLRIGVAIAAFLERGRFRMVTGVTGLGRTVDVRGKGRRAHRRHGERHQCGGYRDQ